MTLIDLASDKFDTLKTSLTQALQANEADKLSSKTMLVTPALAAKWLEKNHPGQRTVSTAKVEHFSRQILEKHWYLTHQGIAFDEEGNLVDGQHRLHAIIKTGVSMQMLVTNGLSLDAIKAIDRGSNNRSVADELRMGYGVEVSKASVALASALWRGAALSDSRSREEQAEFYLEYKDTVDWTSAAAPKHERGTSAAPVLAAGARAFLHYRKQGKLGYVKRFLQVLQEGRGSGPVLDEIVVKMREWILSTSLAGSKNATDAYLRVAKCLVDYVEAASSKTPIKDPLKYKILRPSKDPLPFEKGAKI